MNPDNVKTTPTSKVGVQELLNIALKAHEMSTEENIDIACKLLDILTEHSDHSDHDKRGDRRVYKCTKKIFAILEQLDGRTDVKSEDLNELSQHSEGLNFYCSKDIKNWIKNKHSTILNQKEFEYVEDHFGNCNSDNVQAVIQKEASASSNDYDLEDFDVIEASTGAVGEVDGADEDFVFFY